MTHRRRERSELARSIRGILRDTFLPSENDRVLWHFLYLSDIFLAEARLFLSALTLIKKRKRNISWNVQVHALCINETYVRTNCFVFHCCC